MRAKSSWTQTWHLRHSHQRQLGLWPGEYGIPIVHSSRHHNRLPRHMQRRSVSSQWYYNITDWLMTINQLPNKDPAYLDTVFPSVQEPSCIVIRVNLCPLMLEMLWPLTPSKNRVKIAPAQGANMLKAKFWLKLKLLKIYVIYHNPLRRYISQTIKALIRAMCYILGHSSFWHVPLLSWHPNGLSPGRFKLQLTKSIPSWKWLVLESIGYFISLFPR